MESLRKFPDLCLVGGAPPGNIGAFVEQLDKSEGLVLSKLVMNGGFAGVGVVPDSIPTLPKFEGLTHCATFNFGGAPAAARMLLDSPKIARRVLCSKNVCHRVTYSREMHEILRQFRGSSDFLFRMMEEYGAAAKEKKLHDVLAACAAVDEGVVSLREVSLECVKGKWGSFLKDGTKTFISVDYNHALFTRLLALAPENTPIPEPHVLSIGSVEPSDHLGKKKGLRLAGKHRGEASSSAHEPQEGARGGGDFFREKEREDSRASVAEAGANLLSAAVPKVPDRPPTTEDRGREGKVLGNSEEKGQSIPKQAQTEAERGTTHEQQPISQRTAKATRWILRKKG
uniref:Inosine/uridine-preferring nucleoside hydrolase domain-containing protein n=1 Tax=Chromera velia CCMP2878 TaxID=1169474 RepID=A0A0G4HS90_9ALVE|eukprot:Cvel_30966.t1-p1 / transcript=Cvel_30966.t1 / gene=Cvel_30966 / organism=Chromera_velia_CCMP2878 / gene_product=hypothetical protein / transcript_product=hypothetical protein / location=Cvel_scaffold4517:3097-4119(+) / protein_length=341 / sequence_SO=supercontig / SO=protein_coding / is_pseudo=false